MQELRFVLIVVGILAIAALLFHGLWSSKKEGKAKFGNKPLSKLDVDQGEADLVGQDRNFASAPLDDFEIIRKDRKEPDFGMDNSFDTKIDSDPLLGGISEEKPFRSEPEESPEFVAEKSRDEEVVAQETVIQEPQPTADETVSSEVEAPTRDPDMAEEPVAVLQEESEAEPEEPEMQVIVLNVHCAGEDPFVGTQLFDSMQQNGLIYGEMNIFHRHVDLSGNGKVLFSVANMMQPGTLEHSDPADFTTKGISFFMTLPGFGEAEQNFNLMLRTAQQIADDMGGNVLDDNRNLMTPDRLAAYRRQIVEFKAANA